MGRIEKVIAISAVVGMWGCASHPPMPMQMPAPKTLNGVRVEAKGLISPSYVYLARNGPTGVWGTVTNTTSEPFGLCMVFLELFDVGGAKIADAAATTQNLGAGVTWRFEAFCTSTNTLGTARIEVARVMTDRSAIDDARRNAAAIAPPP